MNFFRFLCCLLLPISLITSGEASGGSLSNFETMFPRAEKKLRIQSLWPSDYVARLAIEPAIPQDFVMKKLPQDAYPGYFAWGPKEFLDTCDFKDLDHIPHSLLCFNASLDAAQTGPTTFSDADALEDAFKQVGAEGVSRHTYMWGNYPVLQIGGTNHGKYLFSAWIGTNYCSNVIRARLLYPSMEGRPNKEDIQLWETFLSQTKPLPEPECLLVQGCDMQTGYTWQDGFGEKVLCVAEKRKSDNLIQVVLICQDNATSFSVRNITHGLGKTSWRGVQLIAKVHVDISKKLVEGGSIEMQATPINVFIKTVEKFSLNKEALVVDPRIFVRQIPL